ncbi:unnamed protein product, partial [marine sediment metagenome]
NVALFRSRDSGHHWERILPSPETPSIVDGDEAVYLYSAAGVWPGGAVTAVAADPDVPGRLWAGVSPHGSWAQKWGASKGIIGTLKILRSSDGGSTWQQDKGTLRGDRIEKIFVDGISPLEMEKRVLYAATGEGVFRSRDGGKTWELSSAEVPAESIHDLAAGFDLASKRTALYVTVRHRDGAPSAIWRSRDQAESWQLIAGPRELPEGIPPRPVGTWRYEAIAACASKPDVIYVSTVYTAADPVGEFYAAYRSTDGGESWQCTLRGDPRLKSQN